MGICPLIFSEGQNAEKRGLTNLLIEVVNFITMNNNFSSTMLIKCVLTVKGVLGGCGLRSGAEERHLCLHKA